MARPTSPPNIAAAAAGRMRARLSARGARVWEGIDKRFVQGRRAQCRPLVVSKSGGDQGRNGVRKAVDRRSPVNGEALKPALYGNNVFDSQDSSAAQHFSMEADISRVKAPWLIDSWISRGRECCIADRLIDTAMVSSDL